jgi:hypothetical protein
MGFVVNSSLGRNYSQERTILTHGEESVLKNKLFVVALSNQGLDDSLVRQGLLALSISASAISDVTTRSKRKDLLAAGDARFAKCSTSQLLIRRIDLVLEKHVGLAHVACSPFLLIGRRLFCGRLISTI